MEQISYTIPPIHPAQQPPRRPHPRLKFTQNEDAILTKLVGEFGENNWETIAKVMPNRNPRQCRERWINYLSPSVSKAPWTPEEDLLLEQKYKEFGSKWVKIATFFPNRTDTMIKNRFNVLARKANKALLSNQEALIKEAVVALLPNAQLQMQPPPQPQIEPPIEIIALPAEEAQKNPSQAPPDKNSTGAPIPPKISYKMATSPVSGA